MADLLSVADALAQVLDRVVPTASELVPLSAALGRTLAAAITSDVDSPPHDKSMMDGFALSHGRRDDGGDGTARGRVDHGRDDPDAPRSGRATRRRIMTVAPIPPGCDAIVMIEKTTTRDGVVVIHDVPRSGQHILRRAATLRVGETVLESGATLNPGRIGLCTEVGRSEVVVHRTDRRGPVDRRRTRTDRRISRPRADSQQQRRTLGRRGSARSAEFRSSWASRGMIASRCEEKFDRV
ncbi:MAG: hypothetical protein QM811_30280 [Pirellulales bacterium]